MTVGLFISETLARLFWRRFRPYALVESWLLVSLLLGQFRIYGENAGGVQTTNRASRWDMALPKLQLQNVNLAASGITEAWQKIGEELGIRTVLYVDWKSPLEKVPFALETSKCSGHELLRAFAVTYRYGITQDARTGVIWLHPASLVYDEILTNKVRVARDLIQAPFATAIFYPLCRLKALGIVNGTFGGMQNTLDSPVDLRAGIYPTRDVLNLLCCGSPNQTFHILVVHNALMVSAVSVMPSKPGGPRFTPGAKLYWQTEVNPLVKEFPSQIELLGGLANSSTVIRGAARHYFDMTQPLANFERVLTEPVPAAQAVWTAVGVLAVMTRADVPAWPSAAACLRKLLSDTNALSDQPALRALGATELARVEKDASFLEQASKRPLSPSELTAVEPDLIRNLSYSAFVREKFLELNPNWAGFSKAVIEGLRQTNIFSLP